MFPHLNRILLLAVLCLELGLYDSLPIANETQREVLRRLYHKLRVDVDGFGMALNFTDVSAPIKDADEGAGSEWSLTGIVDSIMGREQLPPRQIDTGAERPNSMKSQVSATINDIIRNLNVVKDIVAGRNCTNADGAGAHLNHMGAGQSGNHGENDAAVTEDSAQQNLATLTTESNQYGLAHSRSGNRNAHGEISSHKIADLQGPRGVGWERKSQENGDATTATSATSKSIKGFWAQLDLLKATEKSALRGDNNSPAADSATTAGYDLLGKAAKSFGFGANEDQFEVQIEENVNKKGDLGNRISEVENTATEETDSVEKTTGKSSTESSPENKSGDKSDSSNSGGKNNGFIDYNSFFQSLQTAAATTIADEDTSTVTESENGATSTQSSIEVSDEHDAVSGEKYDKSEDVATEGTNFDTSAGDTLQPKFKQAVNAIKNMRKVIFGTTEQPRENADNERVQKGSDEGGENVSGRAVINQLGGDESDSQEKRDDTETTRGTDGDENSQVGESGGGDGYAPQRNSQLGGSNTGGSSSEKDGNNSGSSESKLTVITTAESSEKSAETDEGENNSNEHKRSGAENGKDDSFIVAIGENQRPETNAEDLKKSAEDIDRTGAGSQEGENDELFFIATRAKNTKDGKVKISHPKILPKGSDEDTSQEIVKPGNINLDGSSEVSGSGIVNKIGSAFGNAKNLFGSASESPKTGSNNSEETDDDDVLEKASAGATSVFRKIKSDLGSAAEETKSIKLDGDHSLLTLNTPEMSTSDFAAPGIFTGGDGASKEETQSVFGSVTGGINAAIDNAKDLLESSSEISKEADKLSGQGKGLMGGISSSFGKITDNLGAAQEEMKSGLKTGADNIKEQKNKLHADISDKDNFSIHVTDPSITLSSGESPEIKPGLFDSVANEAGSAFGRAKTLFGGSSDDNQAPTDENSKKSDDLMGKISSGASNVFGKIKNPFGGEGETEVVLPNSEDISDISIVKKIPDATHTISLSAEDIDIPSTDNEGILDKAIGGISAAFDGVKNPFDGTTETSHLKHPEIDLNAEGTDILEGIEGGTTSIFGKVSGVFKSSGEDKKSDENISIEKPEATEKSLTHGIFDIKSESATEKKSDDSGEKQGLLNKVGAEIGHALGKVTGVFDDSSKSSKEDDKSGGISTGSGFGKIKFTLPTEEMSTLPPTFTHGEISVPDITLPEKINLTSEEEGLLGKVSGGISSAFGKIGGVFGGSADSKEEEKGGGSWTSGISNAFGDVAKSAETSITDLGLGVTAPAISAEVAGTVQISTPAPDSGETSGWMGKVAGGFGSALGGAKKIFDGSSEDEKITSSKEKSDGVLDGIAAGSADLFDKIKDTMTSKSDSKEIKIELNERSNELLPGKNLAPSAPELSLFDTDDGESGIDKLTGVFDNTSDKTKNILGHVSETATVGTIDKDISQESKDFLEAVAKETSTMFGKVKNPFESDGVTTETPTKITGSYQLNRFKIDGGPTDHSEEKGTLDSVLDGFGSAFDSTKTIFGSSSDIPNLSTGGRDSKATDDGENKSLLGGVVAGTSSAFGKIKNGLNGDAGSETSEGALTKIKQQTGEISTPEIDSQEEDSVFGNIGNAFDIANAGITELSESAERRLLDTSEEQERSQEILGAVAKETSSMIGKVTNIFGGDAVTEKSATDGVQFSIPEVGQGEIKNPMATDDIQVEGKLDTVFGGIGSAFGANSGKSTEDDSKEQGNSGEGMLGKVASGTESVFGKKKNPFISSDNLGGEQKIKISGEISTPDLKFPGQDSKEDDGALGGIGSAFDRAKTALTETVTEIQPTDGSGEGFLGAVAKGTSTIFGKVKNIFESDKRRKSSSESGVEIPVPVFTTPSPDDDSSEKGALGKVWGGIGSTFNKAKSAVEETTQKSTNGADEINENSNEDRGLLGGIVSGTSNMFGKINAKIDSEKSSGESGTKMTGEISTPEISIHKTVTDSNEDDGIIGGIGSVFERAKTGLSKNQPTESPDTSGEGFLGAVAKGTSSIIGKVKSIIDGDGTAVKTSSETSGKIDLSSPELNLSGADLDVKNSGEGVLSGIGSAFNKASEKSKSGDSKEQQSDENQGGLFAGVTSGTTNLFGKIKDSVPKTSSESDLKLKLPTGEISTPDISVHGEVRDSQEEDGIFDKVIGGIGSAFDKARNEFSETHSTPAPKTSEEENDDGFFGGIVSGATNVFGTIKHKFESDPDSSKSDSSKRKGSVGVVAHTEEEKRKINRIFKSGAGGDRPNLGGIKKSNGAIGANNKQSAEDSDLLGGTLISGAGKFTTSIVGKENDSSDEKSGSIFDSIINKVSDTINATGIGKGVDEAEKSLHGIIQSVQIGGDEGSGEVPAVISHLASGELGNTELTGESEAAAAGGMRSSANSQNADTTTRGQVTPAVHAGGADYDYDLNLEDKREGAEYDENSREGGEIAPPAIKDVPSKENDVEETENVRYEHNLGSNLISPGTNNVEPSMLSMKQFHDNKGNPEPRVNVTFNAPKDKGVYDMYIDRKGRRCSDFTELPLDVEYLREVFVNSGYSNFQLPSLGVNLNELADKAVFFKDLDDNSILCGTLTINHR